MMIVDLTVRGVVVLISQTVTTGGIRFLLISYSIRKPKSTHQSCSTSKIIVTAIAWWCCSGCGLVVVVMVMVSWSSGSVVVLWWRRGLDGNVVNE
uniref:Transmembrane protein n=2 Tax=Helianthus annuus TaxID=4232 RepID=A0A251TWE1_HELAN